MSTRWTGKGESPFRINPYVGPRAFRTGEELPARAMEIRELTDLLIAERIALLHAPSGAGKTSLIQAGVMPMLERESPSRGQPFRPAGPLRVNAPPPVDRPVHNRYVYSIALDLVPDRDPAELADMTLREVIDAALTKSEDRVPVLIFDQFEEILVLDPTDWENQEVFFTELGTVLSDLPVWVLFAMREDYMGGLDRFVHHVPGHLQRTYRLDFLTVEAAKIAIQQPAAGQGVKVTDQAADRLVEELRSIRVQSPRDGIDLVKGPYVQTFQLQVVCRNLWKTLARRKRSGQFTTIDQSLVERYADVGRSLRRYYSEAVAEVAAATKTDELTIRDWFETQLITAEGLRSQTLTGPHSHGEKPAVVARALQDLYLVRSDNRAGSIWFELAHDQMIAPILEDNRHWREARLEVWQFRARDWEVKRQRELLLSGGELRHAQRRAEAVGASRIELDFLEECARVERQRTVIGRARFSTEFLRVAVLVLFVVAVVELALLLWT